jgi:hypothetical protein
LKKIEDLKSLVDKILTLSGTSIDPITGVVTQGTNYIDSRTRDIIEEIKDSVRMFDKHSFTGWLNSAM